MKTLYSVDRNLYAEEPILSKVKALRALGEPTCSDSVSCFSLTKHLRDVPDLQKYVLVKNPRTKLFE
jgi:hypothetical protein